MKSILNFVAELRHIREMATTRQDAIREMVQNSYALNLHLKKLLVFGWNTDWAKTVFDISMHINNIRLKPNSKRLTDALIKEHLFETYCTNDAELMRSIPTFIKNFEHEYNVPVKRSDAKVIAKKYNELKSFLIPRIAKENGVIRSEIYDKIKRTVGGN